MTPLKDQLLLDLGPKPAPTLDNFVAGSNTELLETLRNYPGLPAKERFIHLWGGAGCGRSHLLAALASQFGGRYLMADGQQSDWVFSDHCTLYAVDDVEKLSEELLADLFNLINRCREQPGYGVVTAASAAPAQLLLREDLRTRLGWGLVFQVERLKDDDAASALDTHAAQRGAILPPEVRRYLLTHYVRDLRYLNRLVDKLDEYALSMHRPITLPLVKSFMQEQENQADGT